MKWRDVAGVVVLVFGLACSGFGAEPPVKKDPAPDELPMRLIKVLRTTNKAQTNRYVPKVYTVNNVDPYQLLRWVRRTAQIEDGGWYFFGKPAPDGKITSGKVVVTLPEYMLPGMDEMMKVIDREGLTSSGGDEWFYFRPKHRNVADAGFTNVINTIKGNSGDFAFDTEANTVLVYAIPSKISEVKDWLPQVDTPPPQVMVEVTIYEINVDNGSRIGLDYVAWKNGPGRNLFAHGNFYEKEKITKLETGTTPLLNTGTGGTYGLPGHRFKADGDNCAYYLDVPSAFFDYLSVKNKARVMMAAQISTRNLIPGTLTAGDLILYYKTQVGTTPNAGIRPAGVPLDPNGNNANYPDNRTEVSTETARVAGAKTGVSLTVTPTMGTEGINLRVTSSVVNHVGFDAAGTPVLNSRTADTELLARDGQEIILGGLTREMMIERSDKMPILGSLPILGYLFGGDANTIERRQLVFVLTPYVIADFSAMEHKGKHIDPKLVQARASRKEPVKVPNTEVGFDQWILDNEQ